MNSIITDDTTACYVGVRAVNNVLEIHAVNSRSEVVLKGWFSPEVGIALIGNRPASVIAVDEATVSEEFMSELEDLGHSTVVVPTFEGVRSTSARAICSLGVCLSDRLH